MSASGICAVRCPGYRRHICRDFNCRKAYTSTCRCVCVYTHIYVYIHLITSLLRAMFMPVLGKASDTIFRALTIRFACSSDSGFSLSMVEFVWTAWIHHPEGLFEDSGPRYHSGYGF